jgi:DNA primase
MEDLMNEMVKLSAMELDFYLNEVTEEFPNFRYDSLFNQIQQRKEKSRKTKQLTEAPHHSEEYDITKHKTPGGGGEWGEVPFPEDELQDRGFVPVKELSLIEKAEQQLLYRMLNQNVHHLYQSILEGFQFPHDSYESIYALIQGLSKGEVRQLVKQTRNEQLFNEVEALYFEEEVTEAEIEELVQQISSFEMESEIKMLKQELIQASQTGNTAVVEEVSVKLSKLLIQKKR